MTGSPATGSFSRIERLGATGSTNDVVRGWLAAGTPEICIATAGEQTAGRGRLGRTWTAPAGAALLLTAGFRPSWLPVERVWRLGATVALAMADAAETVAGLPVGAVRLKWPNDLVVEVAGPNALLTGELDAARAAALLAGPLELRKLAGVLAEADGLGTDDPRVAVGIGINADWAAPDFPPELAGTMTSLREASGGRPISVDGLLEAFLGHLETRVDALRAGYFDIATWVGRQALTGRLVLLEGYGAHEDEELVVTGVDAAGGALVVERAAGGEPWLVHAADVVRVRLAQAGV